MDIKKVLIETLEDRFKLNAQVRHIEKMISNKAERDLMDKYHDWQIFENKLQYGLHRVICELYHNEIDMGLQKISIRFIFFCNSKVSEKQNQVIQNAKLFLHENDRLPFKDDKPKLWINAKYEMKIDALFSGQYSFIYGE